MKIRNGFVTNSSSTNYLILSKEELTPEKLSTILGVSQDSPLFDIVLSLCTQLLVKDFIKTSEKVCNSSFEDQLLEAFGEKTLKKYKTLTKKGYVSYHGHVSDNYDDIEALFSMDSFIVDNNDIFMDFSDGMY